MSGNDGQTVDMRDGELVDADALRAWMAVVLPDVVSKHSVLHIRQFPAGFSNLTYRVSISDGETSRDVVLRRPPRGVKTGSAHDMGREHDMLAALHSLGVPVPRSHGRCDDVSIIGVPFYVMEHVDGVILRGRATAELPTDAASSRALLSSLSQTFAKTLAQLHSIDVSRGPLAAMGKPDGYVQRQVAGWTKRWVASQTSRVDEMDRVAVWLDANQPSESRACLVHNDFKFDNLILERASLSRVRAILDWEMATIGDPLMDLGTSLAYWVQADDAPVWRSLGLGVTALPGSMSRRELVDAYAMASGRDVGDTAYYYTFGLFKVAVIAQQIYARYVQGLTADARFAQLSAVVSALGSAATSVIDTGEI